MCDKKEEGDMTSRDIEDIVKNTLPMYILTLLVDDIIRNNINNQDDLHAIIMKYQKEHHAQISKIQILDTYRYLCKNGKYTSNVHIENLLQIKSFRSQSGIIAVAVSMPPGDTCAFDCDYCPDQPGQARSYTAIKMPDGTFSGEPAIIRAMQNDYDPYLQAINRFSDLRAIGHEIDKIEYITLGGTWSSFRESTRYWVISELYRAANDYNCGQTIYVPREKTTIHLEKKIKKMKKKIDILKNMNKYMSDNKITGVFQKINNIEIIRCGTIVDKIEREISELVEQERMFLRTQMKINETAPVHVIGLTIETRPDCVTDREIKMMREMGATRIQLGMQHINDRVLYRINRRCKAIHGIRAIKTLKDNCFKVQVHWMPDLPKPLIAGVISTKSQLTKEDIDWDFDMFEEDMKMFDTVINSPDWQADQWKLYPCQVMPYTKLKTQYEAGLHKPYGEIIVPNPHEVINKKKKKSPQIYTKLVELFISVKPRVPKWIRIDRVVRDHPSSWVEGGTKDANMRQLIDIEMTKRGVQCHCIRCREVKKQTIDPNLAIMKTQIYKASGGTEYHITFETDDEKILFGFVRLRLTNIPGKIIIGREYIKTVFPELEGCALIRELHVYGQTTSVGTLGESGQQHKGFGTRLMNEAFRIAIENGYTKIAVISGNGVKEYYKKKFGFVDTGNYLIKTFETEIKSESNKIIENKNYIIHEICIFFLMILVMMVINTFETKIKFY